MQKPGPMNSVLAGGAECPVALVNEDELFIKHTRTIKPRERTAIVEP